MTTENTTRCVNTARVWTARARRSLTVKEAAAKTCVTPATFRKWQKPSGYSIYLTQLQLERLCGALCYPCAFFTEGDEETDWENLDMVSRQIAPNDKLPSGKQR